MLKFWSQIGLFVQIAIVVAAVVLFNLFDPFGWLNTKKLTLEDTPISVRSIREVGKLITAEYYGEVLTSLQESILEEIKETAEEDIDALKQVEEQFFEAMRDLHERKGSIRLRGINKRKKLYNLFYKDYAVPTHPFFQSYIQYLIDSKGYKSEKRLLKSLYDLEEDNLERKLDSLKININEALVQQFRKEAETVTGNKKFKKSQIVVLGRGWVKAGIDFGSFNENNFKYDKENKTIHLVGMKPQILYSTINPWFIPEKQIKGFEVILITKRAKKPEYMQKVKSRSLKKLRQQAIQSGILKQAKRNAEDNLKSFFSLLLPEGIDEVIIHDDFFSYFDASFVSDTLTAETMKSIDSLLVNRYKTDSQAVVSLRDTLYQKLVQLRKGTYRVNRYSSRLTMADDGLLSAGEMKWLKEEKNALAVTARELSDSTMAIKYRPHRLDSIWFFPESAIVDALRKEVNREFKTEFSWSKVISDHPDYVEDQLRRKEAVKREVFKLMVQKKQSAFEALEVALANSVTQVVLGEITYSTEDEIPSDPKVGKFKSSDDLLLLLDTAIEKRSLHNWTIDTAETVTLATLEEMFKVLRTNWVIDQQTVLAKRDEILKHWKIRVDSQRVELPGRFVSYAAAIENDSALAVDTAYMDYHETRKAATYLSNVVLPDKNLETLKNLHDPLSQIFYYPPTDTFKGFENKVKKKKYWYWAAGKKRKRLKRIFSEQLLQDYIYRQKQAEFEAVLTSLLKDEKTIKANNLPVDRDSLNQIAVDSLSFLNDYLPPPEGRKTESDSLMP